MLERLWLRFAAKFDPFLSLDCARVEGRKGRDQILPCGNLMQKEENEKKPTIAVVAHFVFFRRLFEVYKRGGEDLRMKNCQILVVAESDFKDV